MSFIEDAVEFYREGKWGMHLISGCLITALVIIAERVKVLWVDCAENKHALLSGLNQHIMRGDTQAAVRWLSSQRQGPLARILRAGLLKAHRPDKEIQAALDQASLGEVPKIEQRTGYLAVLSNASTLAALLGTISGLKPRSRACPVKAWTLLQKPRCSLKVSPKPCTVPLSVWAARWSSF